MSALVWLTIPVGALALALLWVAWATRTRPRADTHETVGAHRRFRAPSRPAATARADARRAPRQRLTPARSEAASSLS